MRRGMMKRLLESWFLSLVWGTLSGIRGVTKVFQGGLLFNYEESLDEPSSLAQNVTSRSIVLPYHSNNHNMTADAAQFVFVMGLEGTGHHLMGRIISNSPSFYGLKRSGIHPNFTQRLHSTLFNERQSGLWNIHCHPYVNELNVSNLQTTVVQVLQEIQQVLAVEANTRQSNGRPPPPMQIPINTVTVDSHDKHTYGQMSYPNFGGSCRSLNYPNLDVFYQACDLAKVDCRHIYLYRDPIDVVHSTTVKRRFNTHIPQAIQLYKSMLSIMAQDLETYPDRNLGCVGFYQSNKKGGSNNTNWRELLRTLWGWRNVTKFQEVIRRVYRPPSNETIEARTSSMFHYASQLKSLTLAHERTLRICRSSAPLRF